MGVYIYVHTSLVGVHIYVCTSLVGVYIYVHTSLVGVHIYVDTSLVGVHINVHASLVGGNTYIPSGVSRILARGVLSLHRCRARRRFTAPPPRSVRRALSARISTPM